MFICMYIDLIIIVCFDIVNINNIVCPSACPVNNTSTLIQYHSHIVYLTHNQKNKYYIHINKLQTYIYIKRKND